MFCNKLLRFYLEGRKFFSYKRCSPFRKLSKSVCVLNLLWIWCYFGPYEAYSAFICTAKHFLWKWFVSHLNERLYKRHIAKNRWRRKKDVSTHDLWVVRLVSYHCVIFAQNCDRNKVGIVLQFPDDSLLLDCFVYRYFNFLSNKQHSTIVSILATRHSCPGFDSQHPPKNFRGKIVDVAEVYQQRWLEESWQLLGNVEPTHLVVDSGKLVLQKHKTWSLKPKPMSHLRRISLSLVVSLTPQLQG